METEKSRSFGGLSKSSGRALVALVLRSFRVFPCRLSGPRGNYPNGTRVSDGLSKMFVSVHDHQIDHVAFVCLGAKLRQRGGKLRVGHALHRGYGVGERFVQPLDYLGLVSRGFFEILGSETRSRRRPFQRREIEPSAGHMQEQFVDRAHPFRGTPRIFLLGNGFGYATPIPVMAKWFPDKRGLAAGMIAAGFALGAGILATSRPVEGLIFCVPLGVALLWWTLRQESSAFRIRTRRVLAPLAVGVGVG